VAIRVIESKEQIMVVRALAVQTCDRCEKPFEERHLIACEEVPVLPQEGLVINKTRGTNKDPTSDVEEVVSFVDLCPDCRKVISNLLARIRLDPQHTERRNAVAKVRGSVVAVRSKSKDVSKSKTNPSTTAKKLSVTDDGLKISEDEKSEVCHG